MKLLFSTLLSVLFAAFSADASNPVVEQFINGSGLIVSNNATVYWGASSVFTYDKLAIDGLYTGQPNKAFWSLTATNLLPTVVSNAYTGYTPGTLYWTNVGTAYSSASPYAGGYTVNTNIINPMAWNDVPGWCDGEGLPGQGCITATIGPGTAANTNLVTMVFAPIINGTNAVSYSGNAGGAAVEGVDKLTLVILAKGTAAATVKTNIPTTFLAGAQKIRLVSIGTANYSAGSYATISYITASGYTTP